MSVFQNTIRTGGFLPSESNFARSRNEETIEGGSGGAGPMMPGTVLGKVTATGKYVPSPATGTDGSQIAIAILYDEVDARVGDIVAAVIERSAEVRAEELVYDASVVTELQQYEKWAQLSAVDIQVRTMGPGVQVPE